MKRSNIQRLFSIICILFCIFCFAFTSEAKLTKDQIDRNNVKNYISVEFNEAPLTDIVIMVSEYTGQSFVISAPEDIFLSWIEPNIYKLDLLDSFRLAIISAGLTLHKVDGKKGLHVIRKIASVIPNSKASLGFYHLQNITPEALKDTSEVLYGGSLSINVLEETNVVIFSGSPPLVSQFLDLLEKIDVPNDTDILSIRLKHVSVSSASKALTDTKLLQDNNFFADHWNRSIVIKGTVYERQVAKAIISSIDKPQIGWIDRLEYIHSVDSESVVALLNGAAPNVEVRGVASDRILISGFEKDVEKASVLLHKVDGSGLQVKVEAIIAYLTDRQFNELGIKLSHTSDTGKYALNSNLIDTLISSNTGILLDYFNDVLGITFAAEDGIAHGELLSSPVLTVLNGEEARIHVGQNVPYLSKANFNQNDGESTGTSIERQDIGLTFTVKPVIEPDGDFIHLKVNQVVSNITDDSQLSQDAVDITIDKKEISSTVLVADGDTIFLGGLRSEENGQATDFIPFLGELPFVGKLFTYKSEQKENRHLIVSLRVNVIGRG